MGPKKKGGEKKAGKASKLAKMNEQERVKYLERKMAEEEETKRRKEEMVSAFMKMKLTREEQKGGLNSSKLIDYWRGTRREVKTKELQGDVVTLKDAFDRALQKKNRHIELLLQDLDEAEEQYNMGFRSQLDHMNEMMEIHNTRLNDLVKLHEDERNDLLKRSTKERKHMDKTQEEAERYLDDVVIALDQRHSVLESEIKSEYQAVKEDVRNKNMEEKQALQLHLEETMDNMWRKLQDMVLDFKSGTEEKRRNYNELLSKDKKGVAEVAENNRKILRLQEDVAKLKETLTELGDVEEKRLSGLRTEREELTKELHETRRAVSIDYRNREQRRLQKLAVQTDHLQRIVDEIALHQDQMVKLSQNCLKLEDENEYQEEGLDLTDEEKNYLKRVDKTIAKKHPDFRNLDLIFEKQNHVAIQTSLLKCEQRKLQAENEELKSALREFFQHLAASKDFATDGLLSVQKQFLNHGHGRRKKSKRRPKSCHGRILERTRT